MIELHVIQTPAWIQTLIDDVVLDSVTPLGFIGHLGYRFWEPKNAANDYEGWQIATYPAPYVVAGSHPDDGHAKVAGFNLDVQKLLQVFSDVEAIEWRSPGRYGGRFDGPEISIKGTFAGKSVWLRLFHLPPPDEDLRYAVDPNNGTVRTRIVS